MTSLTDRAIESLSPIESLFAALPVEHHAAAMAEFLGTFTAHERANVLPYAWESFWARPAQLEPTGVWDLWLVRAGRGFGKTRIGSETTRKRVRSGRAGHVTIIGPTAADARDVMIEGPESGLLAVHPPEFRPLYEPSKRLLTWPNGARGHIRSAEDPDSIRGLQSDWVWGDEPASWRHPEAWDMAMFGNRLGNPAAMLTGTPRPIQWLRDLEAKTGTRVTTGSTYDNLANLAPQFIRLVLERYEGTRMGRQELRAEYLDDVEGALWRMATIEATRFARWSVTDPWKALIELVTPDTRLALGLGPWVPDKHERRKWHTWVGVDPPAETAECGIIVGTAPERARYGYDHAVLLDDMTVDGPPEVWGPQVVEAFRKHNAAGVIVEANQGGDMVRSTIHAVDPSVPVHKIRAKESKSDRAEPVSALYGRGWVHHYGHLAKLETQMTTWVADESPSPDRLDAAVHVITHLLKPPTSTGGRAVVLKPPTG